MRAINHALTGAVIGFVVHEPAVAIPAAVVSHFVLDVLPQFGDNKNSEEIVLKSRLFRNLLVADAVLCGLLVLILAIVAPAYWLLAAICAFAAAAPDFLSINRYLNVLRGRKVRYNFVTLWAKRIQWFERPIGAVVEIAWFIAAIIMLRPFLR